MFRNIQKAVNLKQRLIRYSFSFVLFFLTLTGFGQMPIFKRYYIADIPGLGWLAKFYVTHYMHYLGAVILFALVIFIIVDYLLSKRATVKMITLSGYVRGAILAAIVVSGIFLMIRNFPGYRFAPGFIIFLDLSHLAMVMLYLMATLYCLVSKKNWTTRLQRHMIKE